MKPLVAVALQCPQGQEKGFRLDEHYVDYVERSGAKLLPLSPGLGDEALIARLSLADGLILPGGQNIDPALFGQERRVADTPVPARDHAEQLLLAWARQEGMPALGICRGMQLMNVMAGGTLHQVLAEDVPGARNHWQEMPPEQTTHEVDVIDGTLLREITVTPRIAVNSFHRQGIGRLGADVAVEGVSDDGVVEALRWDGAGFCLGVQWHPEILAATRESRALFEAFLG